MSSSFPERPARTRLYEQVAEQISRWIDANELMPGDRLPPERELAVRLGVSRATLSQALVALEVVGVVEVRHGDGTVLSGTSTTRVVDLVREHADRMPEIIDTRDALETKLAKLAAMRRTDEDMARIDEAIGVMSRDIAAGGRGLEGDELFHHAITEAAHSSLLAQLMAEISELIRETRIASLSEPDRPLNSLAGHRLIAEAVRSGDAEAAADAMHKHVQLVSDVGLVSEGGAGTGGTDGGVRDASGAA